MAGPFSSRRDETPQASPNAPHGGMLRTDKQAERAVRGVPSPFDSDRKSRVRLI